MPPHQTSNDFRSRVVRIVLVVVSSMLVVGCGSGGDTGDRFRGAADRIGDVTGMDDEFDDSRDAFQGHIDGERDVLEGHEQERLDMEQNAGDDTTRFCDKAAEYRAELAEGTSLGADRRVEIYRDLLIDAPERAAEVLEPAIEQTRLSLTAPERADDRRAVAEVDQIVLRTCH